MSVAQGILSGTQKSAESSTVSQGSQGTGYASLAAALTSAFRSPRGANAPLWPTGFIPEFDRTQATEIAKK